MTAAAMIEANLPSIDATIAAVGLAGRIVGELRGRLEDALRTIASLEEEKTLLRRELHAMAESAKATRVEGMLETFVRNLDASSR